MPDTGVEEQSARTQLSRGAKFTKGGVAMHGWARVFLRMKVQLCHLDSEAEQRRGPGFGSSRMDPIVDTKYYQSFQYPDER